MLKYTMYKEIVSSLLSVNSIFDSDENMLRCILILIVFTIHCLVQLSIMIFQVYEFINMLRTKILDIDWLVASLYEFISRIFDVLLSFFLLTQVKPKGTEFMNFFYALMIIKYCLTFILLLMLNKIKEKKNYMIANFSIIFLFNFSNICFIINFYGTSTILNPFFASYVGFFVLFFFANAILRFLNRGRSESLSADKYENTYYRFNSHNELDLHQHKEVIPLCLKYYDESAF